MKRTSGVRDLRKLAVLADVDGLVHGEEDGGEEGSGEVLVPVCNLMSVTYLLRTEVEERCVTYPLSRLMMRGAILDRVES